MHINFCDNKNKISDLCKYTKKTSIEYKTRLRNPTAGSVNFFMMQSIYYLSIALLVLHSLCSCYNDHVICTNNRKKMVPRLHRIYTNVSSIKFPDSGNFILRFCSEEFILEVVISIINKQSILVKGT